MSHNKALAEVKSLIAARRDKEAMKLLDSLDIEPENIIEVLDPSDIGGSLWKVNRFDEAIWYLTQAIRIKNNIGSYFMRGMCYFEAGRFQDSVNEFTDILESDLLYLERFRTAIYFFRADANLRLGEYQKAEEDCTKIESNEPFWTDRLRRRDDILDECKRQKSSIRTRNNK